MFASNGVAIKGIEKYSPTMSETMKRYNSGCFAGLISLIAFVPSEVIKIRI